MKRHPNQPNPTKSHACTVGGAISEADLLRAALSWLNAHPCIWAERRNSGMRGRVRMGAPGTPDITGYVMARAAKTRHAVPFGIECKAAKGRREVSQKAWHARAGVWGVPVCYARSLGDVRAFVEGLLEVGR